MDNMKTIKKTKVKVYADGRKILRVEYGMEYLKGNKAPYFFVTGDYGDKAEQGERYVEGDTIYYNNERWMWREAGCLHERVMKHFPELADLIEVHLNNTITGQPTYATENGWYHYENGGLFKAADYLQLSAEQRQQLQDQLMEAATLFEQMAKDTEPKGELNEDVFGKRRQQCLKATFIKFVESLADHYRTKAEAIIAKYELY